MTQSRKVDFLLLGGTIVTMNQNRQIIDSGAIAVDDSKIIWIGPRDQLAANQFAPLQTIDLEGKVIIPGLINTHGHWAMTVFRGLADDLALEAWLNSIWKVEAAVVSPEMVCAGAQLAMIEMIRSGTTCAADMYWYYPESCMAALEAGFRVVNGHSFAAIPGFERREADVKQAINFIDRFQGNELVHACIQAHSTYTTDQQMLEDIAQIMQDKDVVFITHASESLGELEQVRQKYGKTPIEVLDSVGLLGEKTLLAHCVHLSDAEIERLAETHTSVSHCPSSNLKLSSGIARVADLIRAGVNVAFGTDGAASNNDLDLFHEAQLAALVQKGVSGDPTVLPAEKVFAMLTIDGARALGLEKIIGSLEVGKQADLAVIDFNAANLTPCYNIYSHLIYAVSATDVKYTMINGRMVMAERELLTLEEDRVRKTVCQLAERIRLL